MGSREQEKTAKRQRWKKENAQADVACVQFEGDYAKRKTSNMEMTQNDSETKKSVGHLFK